MRHHQNDLGFLKLRFGTRRSVVQIHSPDQFFQLLTPPRCPPDWVHLRPTSPSRVPLPLQFAHEVQDASVYNAMLSANWNGQSTLSPNLQVHHFPERRTPCRDERHGVPLASTEIIQYGQQFPPNTVL